jgi:hypothetical protein
MLDTEFRKKQLSGVAKRGMADIMAQANSLDQIFVEKQVAANGSGYSRDKLDMEDPVGDMVVSDQAENLGLIDIAGISAGVKNAVGILGEVLPVAPQLFLPAPDSGSGPGCQRREVGLFLPSQMLGYTNFRVVVGGFGHGLILYAGYSHSDSYNNARCWMQPGSFFSGWLIREKLMKISIEYCAA